MKEHAWAEGAADGSGERQAAMTVEIRRPPVPPPASQARPPLTSVPVVERQRLARWITRSVEQVPLTLIRAPAGTGKTVVAADWARRSAVTERPVAWLSMSERDNHPAVFWAHLQVSLGLAGVLPGRTDRWPALPDAADSDALSARLSELGVPVVIVIDAADRLLNHAVHDQVRRLLEAGGDRLHVLMTSRVEPALPIHRYRLENSVAELGADDLALAHDEIEEVLVRHHVQPSNGVSAEVLRRTEGWAAGVRLAALQLAREGADGGLDGFAAPYVREEIVTGLTPLERHVLTATAAVDELPPGLAPALTARPDADALVRNLSTGNAFLLPVRGRPGAFRLHPLVRDVLRADLDQGSRGRSSVVHRRAAEWFDDHGELEAAVRHVAAAGDWQSAAARVVEGRGLAEVILGTTTGAALVEDLAAIPATGSPDVTVLRAAMALRDGDLERARVALDQAGGQPAGRTGVAASVVRTAWYDAAGQPSDTLAAAREARSRLEEADEPDPLVAAVVATAEGAAQLRAGDLDAASAALGEAVSATVGIDGPLRLRCLAELALAQACAGHLTRALALADAAEQVAVDEGIPVASRPLALELARVWVAVERQELPQAQRSLNRMGRARTGRDDETWRTALHLLRARYLRDRGDLQGARRQLAQAGSARRSVPRWLRDQLDAEARSLETEAQPPAPWAAPGDYGRVQELLDDADHRCRRGDVAAARADVGRALQLGRAERLRRPFAHASPTIRSLIRNDARVSAMAAWLRPDRPTGGNDASPTMQPVLESLSERELEVLRHLAAFLTTEEIAGAMFISVNTVRTHVRRVLEKLAVSRRYEAVRRGQELGLV